MDYPVSGVFGEYKKGRSGTYGLLRSRSEKKPSTKDTRVHGAGKHITTVGSGKYDINGKEIPRIKEQKIVDKHYQPDTAAIIFTLTNGEPENWKNRQNNEVTGKDGKDLFGQLTDEELDARIAELEKKLDK